MNKNEALKQIEELKAKLAELEATVNEPEYKPEDLVGKLCYVQKFSGGQIEIITSYNHGGFHTACGVWDDAQPVPESEVLKLIYKPNIKSKVLDWPITCVNGPEKLSRYNWSKVPAKAKYMYTDSNGNVFWATIPFDTCNEAGVWLSNGSLISDNWNYISKDNSPCDDWKDSEEARPE